MNLSQQGGSAAFTLLLAIILGPSDYGTVSMAVVFIAFVDMFLDQGFVSAIIQRKKLEAEHSNSIFWIMVGSSPILLLLTYVVSGWWANLNNLPELALIINIMALKVPLGALSRVQQALMHRESNFRLLAFRDSTSVMVSGMIGITMALTGFGIWSMVAQQILKEAISTAILWKVTPWTPTFSFSKKHAKDLLSFSSANFLAKLGIFVGDNAAVILIGLFFGPVAVGLYRFATRLVQLALQILTQSLQTYSLPALSRLQDNPTEYRVCLKNLMQGSTLITMPTLGVFAALSLPIMTLTGEKWIPAATVMQILCIGGAVESLHQFTSPVLQSLNKTFLLARIVWTQGVANLIMLAILSSLLEGLSDTSQTIGLAVGRSSLACFLSIPILMYVLLKYTPLKISDIRQSTLSAITTGLLGFFTASTALHYSHRLNLHPLLAVVSISILCAAIMLILLYHTNPRARLLIFDFYNNKFRK